MSTSFKNFLSQLALVALAVGLSGCLLAEVGVRSAEVAIVEPCAGVATVSTSVEPYFSAAPNWNTYVRTASPATLCDGTETGIHSACRNGGEWKQVSLPGYTSCDGLSLSETLGHFQWKCEVSGGTARFISTGLKPEVSLKHLISKVAGVFVWQPNSVKIQRSGCPVAETTAAAWWSNPISEIIENNGTGVQTLSAAGTVYYVQPYTYLISDGLVIGADRVAIVPLEGALVRYSGSNGTRLLSATNRKFIWVEGNYMGTPTSGGNISTVVEINAVKFSRFKNLGAEGGLNNAFYGDGITGNLFEGVNVFNGKWAMVIANFSEYNVFRGIRVSNTEIQGFWNSVSFRSYYSQVLGSAGVGALTWSDGSSYNTISHATAVNSDIGLSTAQISHHQLFSNLLLANNAVGLSHGFFATNSYSTTTADVAAVNNATGIYAENLDNSTFTKKILLGGNGVDCSVVGGTNPGLVNTTCGNQGTSDAALVTGKTAANSFKGKVTTTDTVNTNNTAGLSAFTSIVDWSRFENPFRLWGLDGGAFPRSEERR
ncbi:MAG: hypothetical protein AB7P04_13135, partial [Bacteriovoracia bacterium]